DPRLAQQGKNPLVLDSKPPSIPFEEYAYLETRYKMLQRSNPAEAKRLMKLAQEDAQSRWRSYEKLASRKSEETEPETSRLQPLLQGGKRSPFRDPNRKVLR